MHDRRSSKLPKVLSYPGLRRSGGYIGVALPLVLSIGDKICHGRWLEESMSAFYYTDMRNIFVGGLCAIAVFLVACKGFDERDAIVGNIAGFLAVMVAFFPTTKSQCFEKKSSLIGSIHYTCAVLLFLMLTYFCLVLFQKTGADIQMRTHRKVLRNRVYSICGSIMLGCIVLGGITSVPAIKETLHWCSRLFWFESIAVVSFGFAWLTKGEGILKDQSAPTVTEDTSRV